MAAESKQIVDQYRKPSVLMWIVLIIIIMAIVAYFGMSKQKEKKQNLSKTTIPVSIGMAMHPTGALYMIAMDKGYFKSEGLKITTKEYPSGKRALYDGLYKNEVEIVTSGDMPITIAGMEQRKIKVIASVFSANNVNRIIARTDAGINKPTDLIGKKIATQYGSQVHYFLHLFLLENGLSDKDVEQSFMKAELLPVALINGDIDAFSMREPYISIAKKQMGDKAVIFSAPGIYNQTELVVATNNFIKNKPEAVLRMLRALKKAETFAATYPNQAISVVARYLKVSHEKIAPLWPELKARVLLDQSLLLMLENQARWVNKIKTSSAGDVPNYLDYIYLDGLHQIEPEAVTVMH